MADYSHLDDRELLLLMQKGEEGAFTEIYNRYWERLVATGYYYTRRKEEAEEVVNDVLMGLWLRKGELDIRSLPAYLGTAVKFAVFKVIARRRKLDTIPGDETAFEIPHTETEERLDARFLKEFLEGVIEQLPEKARLVFKYSREEELPVREIAEKLELSPKAVEYHMTKALKSLRESIKKMSLFSWF